MRPSKKRLTLSVLLLLGPTVLVGWLGLREIGRLEEQVAGSMSAGVTIHLRGAEVEFRDLLERSVESSLRQLRDQAIAQVERTLRDLPRTGGPVLAGLLLAPNGQAIFPIVPARRNPEPSLPPAWSPNLEPRFRDLLIAIKTAEWFAMLDEFEEALGTIEAFAATHKIPPGENVASARLAYELGRFKLRRNDHAGALAEFGRARQRVQGLARRNRGRSGLQALYLLISIHEIEAQERLAADSPGDRQQRVGRILDLLEGIAEGDHDAENDQWLQWVYDRAEGLAEGDAAGDDALRDRLQQLRERNRERVTLRLLAADLLVQRLEFPADVPDDYLETLPLHAEGGTSLLVFRPVTLRSGSSKTRLWAGLQVDLALLYADLITKTERQLSNAGREYRIDLVDARDRSVVSGIESVGATLRDNVPRRPLGPPLVPFSLVAIPHDPTGLEQETRRSLVVKAALLIALAIVAGAGALVLVRTVRREAELADMKTDFVGRVSHELKTPLALIRMYGETLAMGRVDDPARISQFATIIAKESDRLTGMIDNVLDFSRIEAGTKIYTPTPTRLDLHLKNTLRTYEPHLAEQGFRLVVSDLPPLSANVDPEGLTQAVVNLLDNACKYTTEEADRRILVNLERNGGQAQIEILDRGIGVPEDEQQRVFETFYRASTAGERHGVGLGLALVKHFAEQHAGSAAYEARPGGGSVVRIVLPLADKTAATGESARQPENGDEGNG